MYLIQYLSEQMGLELWKEMGSCAKEIILKSHLFLFQLAEH